MLRTSKNMKLSIPPSILFPVVMVVLAACQVQPVDELEIKLEAALEHADTDSSEIQRIPYMVVPVDVTAEGISTRNSEVELTLGSPKANSARFDLQILTMSGNRVADRYFAYDPRLQKIEGGSFLVAESAVMYVFVPLSDDVDKVTILPAPGREAFVSEGGNFDPIPLFGTACSNLTPSRQRMQFPVCTAFTVHVVDDPVL